VKARLVVLAWALSPVWFALLLVALRVFAK